MNASNLGFPRAHRVRKRADFLRIQDSPSRVSTAHLRMLFAAAKEAAGAAQPAKLGVVASRKVGNAVARNRAKRLVRELFRKNRDLFPPGVDVVVIVRPGTHERSYAELEAELVQVRPLIARRAADALRVASRPHDPKRSGEA